MEQQIKFLEKPYTSKEIEAILHPTIKKWFFGKFEKFSLPQLYGVMEVKKRNNVLISAPTGATKTLTSFLSIINELYDLDEKNLLEDRIYCIYVSPLRALNEDIKVNLIQPLQEIEKIAARKTKIRVMVRTSDTTAREKAYMLKKPPHILITTPESLAIILNSKRFQEHLKKIDYIIIDEIHALAENKRGVHLSLSLERLQRLAGNFTRIGLSATIAPLEEVAKFLVGYEQGKPRPCNIVNVQFIKKSDLKVLSPTKDLIDITYGEMSKAMYDLIHKLIQEHRTTLIFTNTRSATERVVNKLKELYPKYYTSATIGAHHSSLSASHRRRIEEGLRKGKFKCVVSSTSLELGIDIGYIDLVICLGSPKSVARFLQRAGRAGHKLHDIVKARIIVLDRDDLVECSLLLKSAKERKIDRVHIPKNCLDVLCQHIYGIAINEKIHIDALYKLIKQSYCYKDLPRKAFNDVIAYLSGSYANLEDKNVYAKIWYDPETGFIGRRGKLSRMIYMTNIGTIPEETYVTVKIGNDVIGHIEESFLERLNRGDVFVLGGETYEFLYARGMTAYVKTSIDRPPTVPSWFSEMLPLSFDLAMEIQKFRRFIEDRFLMKESKEKIIEFINNYLYIDKNSAEAIYNYFEEQFKYAEIPHDKKLLIEYYYDKDRQVHYAIVHSLFGRRVNDCLSRATAYVIGKSLNKNIEIGINDNGFYLASSSRLPLKKAFEFLKHERLDELLKLAIDKTEVLKRRFRHCAARSLMILRSYMGKTKSITRQQRMASLLFNAVKKISDDFPVLQEARREVLEDAMDIENAKKVVKAIQEGKVKIKEIQTNLPSPFALNLVTQGYADLFKIEDRVEFLRRMHSEILKRIKKDKEK